MPEWTAQLAEPWMESLGPVGLLVAAAAAGLGVHLALFPLLKSMARRSPTVFLRAFVERCAAPSRLLLPAVAVYLTAPGAIPEAGGADGRADPD